jgi:dihydroflavonol-4-reductase
MPAYVNTGLNIVHVDDVARGHLLAFEKGEVGQGYVLGGRNMSLHDILGTIAAMTGNPAPRIQLPHNLVLPVAYMAEAWARYLGGNEPFVTVDGVRQAKKLMYFSSDKARRCLGYTARPAEEALFEAIEWFRENGHGVRRPINAVVNLPQTRKV